MPLPSLSHTRKKTTTMKHLLVFRITLILITGTCFSQRPPYIIVDQFGYLPEAKKIAVLKNPQTGFDNSNTYTPSPTISLINKTTGSTIFTASPQIWNNGNTDPSSGDKVWRFDFSSITTIGEYYIQDIANNETSYTFVISDTVYNAALKHAFRYFYYQRSNFSKEAQYAGNWTDGIDHMGPLQDAECRLYSTKTDISTQRDLRGGWYDAGDYNKYTSWTADYIIQLLMTYKENPSIWTDDFGIPESENGISDLLDEIKYGLDHLLRLQESNGGLLSVVSCGDASPPSTATAQSLYGPATTNSSLMGASAFALAATIYTDNTYNQTLKIAAENAWSFAIDNPNLKFYNNDATYGTQGIAAGQQEVNDYKRAMSKLKAAAYLYAATGNNTYKIFFENNYTNAHMIQWYYVYPFEAQIQDMLLYYASLTGINNTVSNTIISRYQAGMDKDEIFIAYDNDNDSYLSHLKDYTWGSNGQKSKVGLEYMNLINYNIYTARHTDAKNAASHYIHYLHGVNPKNISYLTNMNNLGAENSVNEIFHSWFNDDNPLYDRVGVSTYGPAPGFLAGGPNPNYSIDGCCPNDCDGVANNAKCLSEDLSIILNQPDQKSYKDFNNSWPLNSWEVTENSNNYQVHYLRLLANFIKKPDCNGDKGGTAIVDSCGTCVEGNTGITGIYNPNLCITGIKEYKHRFSFSVYPNPINDEITLSSSIPGISEVSAVKGN